MNIEDMGYVSFLRVRSRQSWRPDLGRLQATCRHPDFWLFTAGRHQLCLAPVLRASESQHVQLRLVALRTMRM
jgi:hypothetical protein